MSNIDKKLLSETDYIPMAKVRDVKTPERGSDFSAGLDFFIPNDVEWELFKLLPGDDILIKSGIQVNMMVPHLKNYALIANDKSGIALNNKLKVAAKIIDADYQGEIGLHVYNYSNQEVVIKRGQKLVQFLCQEVKYVEPLILPIDILYDKETARGNGGFGSTGIK